MGDNKSRCGTKWNAERGWYYYCECQTIWQLFNEPYKTCEGDE